MDEQMRAGGCAEKLRRQGRPYPRTCAACGLGPCKFVLETVEVPPGAATATIKDLIRLAGGIVHSDGNIFFTSAEQFTKAAAALSQPAAAEWHPIDTAPVNTDVLACNPCGFVGRAHKDKTGHWNHIGNPTHWMAIPVAPKATQ